MADATGTVLSNADSNMMFASHKKREQDFFPKDAKVKVKEKAKVKEKGKTEKKEKENPIHQSPVTIAEKLVIGPANAAVKENQKEKKVKESFVTTVRNQDTNHQTVGTTTDKAKVTKAKTEKEKAKREKEKATQPSHATIAEKLVIGPANAAVKEKERKATEKVNTEKAMITGPHLYTNIEQTQPHQLVVSTQIINQQKAGALAEITMPKSATST
jgi:hypothetical protein